MFFIYDWQIQIQGNDEKNKIVRKLHMYCFDSAIYLVQFYVYNYIYV